jgi:hypothetical protein
MANQFVYVGGRAGSYRSPCGGWFDQPKYFFGSKYQHSIPSHRDIAQYDNLTEVPNYDHSGGAPATISPYQRPDGSIGGCGGMNQPVCGPWPEAEIVTNIFAPTDPPTTFSFSTCRKIGFKYLVGLKTWHGRFAFGDGDGCCAGQPRPPVNVNPSLTKYLRIDWSAEYHVEYPVTFNAGTGHNEYTAVDPDTQVTHYFSSGTCIVDRYSGMRTYSAVDNHATGLNPETGMPYSGAPGDDGVGVINADLQAIIEADLCRRRVSVNSTSGNGVSPIQVTLSEPIDFNTGDSITLFGILGNTAANGTFTVTKVDKHTFTLDGTTGNGAYLSGGWAGPFDMWSPAYDEITPTIAQVIVHNLYPSGSFGAMTAAMTRTSSATGLHFAFVLPASADDLIQGHSYRTFDVTITLSVPYTSSNVHTDVDAALAYWDFSDDKLYPWRYDMRCTAGPMVGYHEALSPQTPVVNPSGVSDTFGFTGAILGAPNSVLAPYFDFRHVEFQDFSGGSGIHPDLRPVAYGQWNTIAHAEFVGTPYATMWTNLADEASLLPGRFQAYNSLIDLATDDGFIYRSGQLLKSKYAEIHVRNFSINFARPCGPEDAATYDQVDISDGGSFDCAGPAADLRWPAADNPCTVSECFDNYPKGQFILAEWTYNYRENYTDPTIGGSPNPGYRPVTQALQARRLGQWCLPFKPCCPAIIFLSDQLEETPNSICFEADPIDLDECFGSLWQSAPLQWITDPFWQRPHRPCDLAGGIAWTEDDGSGHADTIDTAYYPQRPRVEALIRLPAGAPDLDPTAVPLYYFSVGDQNDGFLVEGKDGIIVSPPSPGACWFPWWVWQLNIEANIGRAGRFSDIYADPLAVGAEDPELDPP